MTDPTDSIRLGLMAPFSGLVELYGQEISWAGQVAAGEINDAGGILGRPLELIVEDDGSLPETAVPAANRLIDDHACVAIIGNLLSNSRISVASMVAEPKRVPYLNFSFYEGSIWSRYFFHFAALPNQQIDKMIPYMADEVGPKMFFAGSNYEWPRGSIDAAKRALMAHHGEIVGEEYLPFGTSDFSNLLDGVAVSGADVFVPYFAGSDQTNLLTQFTERGLKNHMAVVMGHYDEAMVSALPPVVRKGFYSSNTYFMSVDTPESRAYLDRLAARNDVSGIWPNGNGVLTNFGEGTYLCVKAFAAAVEKAGSLDVEAIVEALETIQLRSPQGIVEMDPVTHHAKVNTHLSRCNADGTFSLVQSFGTLPPRIPALYRDVFPGLAASSTPLDAVTVTANDTAPSARDDGQRAAAIIRTDVDAMIVSANETAATIFGYPVGEMVGLSVHLLLPPHLRDQHKRYFNQFLSDARKTVSLSGRDQLLGYRKDGSQFPLQATVTKVKVGDGWKLIATLFDLSEQTVTSNQLSAQTSFDPLTKLINRTLMEERLSNALGRSVRSGTPVRLVAVDLNGFTQFNETHGFDTGDAVLMSIAKDLIETAAPGEVVSRFGGDEFLALSERAGAQADEDPAGRIKGLVKRSVARIDPALDLDADVRVMAFDGATTSLADVLSQMDG